MIEIPCRLHEPGRAIAHQTTLRVYPDGTIERGAPFAAVTGMERLAVSPRIGRAARRLVFDDGISGESDDNDAVDRALASCGRHRYRNAGLRARLEGRWRWAAAALLLTIVAAWLLLDRGLPAAARWIAAGTPAPVRAELGARTLAALDRSVLQPSGLGAGTRARLRRRFEGLAATAATGAAPVLRFRHAPALGANALALPGGTIVVTDALVRLAGSDEEVLAVLAHELAHLAHRHGLRKVLQDSGIAVAVVAATGDVSWLSTALPSALLSARYSRAFEREADAAAGGYLRRAGIDTAHFRRILERLGAARAGGGGFLATHPGLGARHEAVGAGG